MKSLQIAFLLAALFALGNAASSIWGGRIRGDFLLLNETVRRNPVAGSYINVEVKFPRSGQTNYRNITAIQIIDKYPRGQGAYGYLWSGGPGYKFATVVLKSLYGGGINSTVEIYGR